MALFKRAARVSLGAIGAIGALAACQQLLGLDGYKDCSEANAGCDGGFPDGSQPDVVAADADIDASTDAAEAGPIFPLGSTGSDWVTFRVPFVDGGLVDATTFSNPGAFAFNPIAADFQVLAPADAGGVPVVRDLVTGRTWFVLTGDAQKTFKFADANRACASLNARVPTRIELVSILDTTQTGSAGMVRPEIVPPALAPATYWSSTAVATGSGTFSFWVMDFTTGRTMLKPDGTAAQYGVLCILK